MKKMRKGKKILLISLIVLIAAIAIVLIIKNVGKMQHETPEVPEEAPVILLPETTYSDMQVKNIQMEYLKDNDQTMITMDIFNTTSNKVEKEHFDAILIGSNENVLGQLQTYISSLEPGEQCSVSVIYKGDLTETTHIKLKKK